MYAESGKLFFLIPARSLQNFAVNFPPRFQRIPNKLARRTFRVQIYSFKDKRRKGLKHWKH